ncbi:MAG: glycosyltransferase family 4 protein [Armatimonadetes bacterium]|nr:glycosyltransferase family 4 protein [Armatimonadota bacterium]
MNIAITSMYLPSGSKIGVGYQVHYLANELVKRGHRVTVFSQTGTSADSLYEAVIVPSGRRLRTFGFAWNLRRYDFTQFDVLNACGDDWFLWGRPRPRHVHTFMGSCLAEMLHARTLVGKARMGLLALCEATACLLAEEKVAISWNTCRYLPLVKKVIPCGVNMDHFHPGQKSEAPSLLFVGTMHGRKRGAMLLDQFQRVIRPRVPDAEFWAVCEEPVGGEGVRWFGRIPLETLADLYRRAWVFCLPSSYEGFGVPYIEAMASGTPVVATPNVGAREVTQEGRAGRLVRDQDLAEALVEVLTDADLRQRLCEAGLQRAQDFTWDRVCAQYEALYAGRREAEAVRP